MSVFWTGVETGVVYWEPLGDFENFHDGAIVGVDLKFVGVDPGVVLSSLRRTLELFRL